MTQHRHHRIGIGGIAIECCTFSPLDTTLEDFIIRHGEAIQETYPSLRGWTSRTRGDISYFSCLKARATSGGSGSAGSVRT